MSLIEHKNEPYNQFLLQSSLNEPGNLNIYKTLLPKSSDEYTLSCYNEHLLLVPVFVHRPLAGEDSISLRKPCV